jgi:hypothetical protein
MIRVPRSRRVLSQFLLLLVAALGATRASAQPTMAGVARDANLGTPLQCLHVAMLDSAGNAVAHTVTDSAGEFMLEAKRPGVYRVEFIIPGWEHLSSLPDTLTESDFHQHQYPLTFTKMTGVDSVLGLMPRMRTEGLTPEERERMEADRRREAESAWSSVRVMPMQTGLRYPNHLREKGIGGYVLAQFVVDSTGKARRETWQLVHATHADFETARRSSLAEQRWTPARNGDKHVCELVRDYTRFFTEGANGTILVGEQ